MSVQRRSEETQARILEAAMICFAQQGYQAASVAQICRQAGVSKGAFYHHFPSKQELFLRLLSDWLGDLDRQLAAVRAQAATVPQALMDMATMFQQVFQEAGGQLPMFLEFWTQAARDPEVWQATIAPYARYQRLFSDLIEAGIQEGSLRPVDPALSARLVVSLAVGVLLQGLLDPRGADWGRVGREGMRLVLDGMASAAGPMPAARDKVRRSPRERDGDWRVW